MSLRRLVSVAAVCSLSLVGKGDEVSSRCCVVREFGIESNVIVMLRKLCLGHCTRRK